MRYIRLCALVLLGMGTTVAVAQTAPTQNQRVLIRRSERSEILRTDSKTVFGPVWIGQVLIGAELNYTSTPIIWTVDRTGRKEEIQFSIPEAGQLILWKLAASDTGTIAVVGTAVGNDSQGSGFLGIIPPDRSKKIIVRTWPYIPYVTAIAPDGVIWTVGWDVNGRQHTYNILKRFDPSGKLLSSEKIEVKHAIAKYNEPGDVSYGSELRSSKDRIGWYTPGFEYIEFSLDGREMDRFFGPPWSVNWTATTIALRSDNEVVAYARGKDQSMWILDRGKRSWISLPIAGEPLDIVAQVFGFDGDDLVVGTPSPNRGYMIVHCSLSSNTLQSAPQ